MFSIISWDTLCAALILYIIWIDNIICIFEPMFIQKDFISRGLFIVAYDCLGFVLLVSQKPGLNILVI